MVSEDMERDIRVCVKIRPSGGLDVFRVSAADDILRLLVDAHESEFTISELVEATGAARSTVWRAVALLEELDVVRVRETPQRNYVSIDQEHLVKPADPILAIEQELFHRPVRTFVEEIQTKLDDRGAVEQLVGIVLFGSVARGTADRRSDVDIFVVVEGDRTTARRRVADIVSDLRERRFEGDRFDFETYVETVDSARRAADKLQPIFEEGIILYGTDELESLRRSVLTDE